MFFLVYISGSLLAIGGLYLLLKKLGAGEAKRFTSPGDVEKVLLQEGVRAEADAITLSEDRHMALVRTVSGTGMLVKAMGHHWQLQPLSTGEKVRAVNETMMALPASKWTDETCLFEFETADDRNIWLSRLSGSRETAGKEAR